MNSKLLRTLVVGNLLVYLVVVGLFVYFALFPGDSTTAAADQGGVGSNPFISLSIPTPTEFAIQQTQAPITPIAFDTPIITTPLPNPTAGGPTVTPVPPPPTAQPVTDRGLVPPSAINIVLLGTDMRAPGASNWRTDTIILVSIDQEHKTVGLLSIPRDLWVRIPGIGPQRINTADFYGDYYHLPGGGPQTVKSAIEQNLGIRVHYYVRVGFDSFRKAIDTLGGVDVDVDCAVQENGFSDDYGSINLNFQPGVQHMDGVTALRYARSRYTTNDYDRSRRQRKVLLAMWDKALSLNLLPKWPELYSQFHDSVQTDLGPTELASLAWTGSQLRMDRIKSRAIDNRVTSPWTGPNGEMVILPQPERIHSLLVEFFSQPTNEADPFETENARVQVVSGNASMANVASVTLKRQGFQMADPQAAPSVAPASSIIVYNSKPTTVQRLVSALRLNPNSVRTASTPSDVDIQVILGQDYNSCQR
ncbi:MAG: LCP family protein [Anaerolineae bacterium]